MSLRVTVVDEQTGESDTIRVPDNDYLLTCVGSCYLHHAQTYANGTHVLTVKGRKPSAEPTGEKG